MILIPVVFSALNKIRDSVSFALFKQGSYSIGLYDSIGLIVIVDVLCC